MKYKSHAVSARRIEPNDSLDDFPTPPWATRALMEHVIDKNYLWSMTCLEPACGAGHMAKVLNKHFAETTASDIFDYSFGSVRDFLRAPYEHESVDWIITNPPFRLAEDFILSALKIARVGVAIIARTVFLESVGRYNNIYLKQPPSKFTQFVERVTMVKGRLDNGTTTTATSYAWFVWEKTSLEKPQLMWIPPCRQKLELSEDYPPSEKIIVNTNIEDLI